MQFIATFWWLWLVAAIIFTGLGIFSQLQNMKNLHSSRFSNRSFLNGFGLTIALMGAGSLGWLAFVLSMIIHLGTYLKHV
jgi:uncharacterized membrane protein YhaH (DUF805 family)